MRELERIGLSVETELERLRRVLVLCQLLRAAEVTALALERLRATSCLQEGEADG
jgi:hypothetical protein